MDRRRIDIPSSINSGYQKGSDVNSVLDSLLSLEATSREVGDALVQLAHVTPKSPEARHALATDPRFLALLDLLVATLPSLHGNRVGALLNPLCKLCPTRLPPHVLHAIRGRLDETLEELTPTNLCTVAFSFCRLQTGVADDRHRGGQGSVKWWQAFVEQSENRLIEFSAWELCQLLRSLLVLQTEHRGVATWLTTRSFLDLWVQCASRRLHAFSGEELEMLATSFSKIPPFHYRLPIPFLERLCGAVAASEEAQEAEEGEGGKGEVGPSMGPVLLCRFFHAVSRMGYHPGRDWMALFEQKAAGFVQTRRWGQAEHALFLQGCSWLRHQPGERLLSDLLASSRTLLQQGVLSSVNLGTMVVALGELRRPPDEAWMTAFLQACEPLLPSMGSKDLGYILKGLAKLHWHPGEEFMSRLLSLLQPSLPRSSSTELQLLLTALVALNHPPPPAFSAALMAAVGNVRPLPPRDLVLILWSLAALDVEGPPPDMGAHFYADMLRRAHNLVHADVASLTTAIQQQQQQQRQQKEEKEEKERKGSGKKGAREKGNKNRPLPGRTDKWGLIARLRQLRQVLAHTSTVPALQGVADPGMGDLIETALVLCGPDATSMVRAKGAVTPFHTEVRTMLEMAGGQLEQEAVVSTFKLDLLLHPTNNNSNRKESNNKNPRPITTAVFPPPAQGGGKQGKQGAKAGKSSQGEMSAMSAMSAGKGAPRGGEERRLLPLLILLFGPSRFLRNNPERLEAGTAFKQRMLSAQAGRRYQAVVWVSHREWGASRGLRAKMELLRGKVEEQGDCRLEDYCAGE